MNIHQHANVDPQKLQDLVGMAIRDLSGSNGGVMITLGHKLGLYKALANAGPLSSGEVANRAGCAERYVREWLNSQVAAGYLLYHPATQSYEMSPEQAMMLAEESSPVFMPNAWMVAASLWADEAKAADAFRTGKGVPWGDHDGRLYCGVAAFFRNGYQAHLVQDWLPALDGMTAKLEKGAKVADIGCGYGHSTIIMAKAFPDARFWGFDVHGPSIEEARRNAEREGVADRVTFEVAKATDYASRDFDLICFFDCLHDMGHPDKALQHAAKSLSPDGSVMLVEPFANDKLEDNINPISRMYFGSSSMLCCAHAISENGNFVLGAQAGEARLAEVAKANGFAHVRRATATPFNLILELRR